MYFLGFINLLTNKIAVFLSTFRAELMNIALDFGNTFVKAGVFNDKELLEVKSFEQFNHIIHFLKSHNPENVVIADVVGDKSADVISQINARFNTFKLNQFTKVPLFNKYLTPETLGPDRICAAVGANALFKNTNVLNIDTGTCIKYNFINNQNEFLGGAISPGIQMRFKALNAFTGKLPLLEANELEFKLIGQNTSESIQSGVLFSAVAEVIKIIEYYSQLFSDLKVVVSGGDTDFLAKHLKNTIFAHPNLVLIGLNEILLYNIN